MLRKSRYACIFPLILITFVICVHVTFDTSNPLQPERTSNITVQAISSQPGLKNVEHNVSTVQTSKSEDRGNIKDISEDRSNDKNDSTSTAKAETEESKPSTQSESKKSSVSPTVSKPIQGVEAASVKKINESYGTPHANSSSNPGFSGDSKYASMSFSDRRRMALFGHTNVSQPAQTSQQEYVDIANRPPNVLWIICDDMRPEIGAYIDPPKKPWLHAKIKTPNLDNLAARSLVLHKAYVQVPRCGPSRASLLTSRRPDTLHVHNNDLWFRKVGNGASLVTLPQYFKQNNYTTIGMGKVFHLLGTEMYNQDQLNSWSKTFYQPRYHYDRLVETSWAAVAPEKLHYKQLRDQMLVEHAKGRIPIYADKYKKGNDPFFMAVGIKMPHFPLVFPSKFLDLYPKEEITYPANDYVPHKMPKIAWHNSRNLLSFDDIQPFHEDWDVNSTLPRNITLQLRRAYYACVSYVDSLVGELLEVVESSGIKDKTIVVFNSDHGVQLGEHGIWGKDTNLELSLNAPLMISIPGLTNNGINSEALTEMVDLFPTLVEAAGLPKVPPCPKNSSDTKLCTEGVSMLPLVKNSDDTQWKSRVFSQYPHPDFGPPSHMGYSIRTHKYRYTEWVNFSGATPEVWSQPLATELYDLSRDLSENHNYAGEREYKDVQTDLSEQLHKGWRAAVPT